MKLKSLTGLEVNNIPDHLLEEIVQLSLDLSAATFPHFQGKSPNISLAAFAFLHSAIIRRLVVDDPEQLRNAARLSAKSLVDNLERLIKKDA